jgi:uncharacterized protein YbaR (Trm112 family)
MFIELTDLLRCPADHDESYLVLLPGRMEGRTVVSGSLGCPICHRTYRIESGIAELGPVLPPSGGEPGAPIDAAALQALLGLEGPGGYLGLIGEVAEQGSGLGGLLPGIHLVAVNPPEGLTESPSMSVLRSPVLPIKRHSLRGAVVGRDYAGDRRWIMDAVRSILPGLRLVAEGPAPDVPAVDLLAEAGGWWVGRGRSQP